MLSALAVTVLLVTTACSGAVEVDDPDLDGDALAACEAFSADLPDTLAGEERRESDPADALGAAYGDPAIVVTCGEPVPEGFDNLTSSCEVANGVGWYVPPEEFDDQGADVTLSTAGYDPVVRITMPGDYRPDGPAAAIAELAAAVEAHTTLVENCI